MKTGPVLLEAEKLVVERGGVTVLDIPALQLRENEVLSLIGPNGAGKSTLLLALARLLPIADGTIRYLDEPVLSRREIFSYRRKLAVVFQEPLLFDSTVFDNVASGLKIRGLPKDEVRCRVAETLRLFKIEHLSGRSARNLSGGEAQRTSLARAFAIRPKMILLDEPFSSLDPPTRNALTDDLEGILKGTGTAAVIATHDQLEALRMADRMAVMENGRIVQSGPPVEVMSRPTDEFVASFVGMENILSATVAGCRDGMLSVRLGGHGIEFTGSAKPGDSVVFCVHPEHITVSTSDPGKETSARNVFPATITRIVPMGVYQKLHLDCGYPLVAYLTRQSMADLHLKAGTPVYVSFKATAVHLIRPEE